MDNKINYCKNCGWEQQIVGNIDFYCERCGAFNSKDGSVSYNASKQDIENMKYWIKAFGNTK